METLSRAESEKVLQRQEAALELALLIERHSCRHDSETYYQEMLRPEQLKISLTEEEQNELLDELGRRVLSDTGAPWLVWPLTKSTSLKAYEYLDCFLCSRPNISDHIHTWQALLGVTLFLENSESHKHREACAIAIAQGLPDALKKIEITCEDGGPLSYREEVREAARRVMGFLENQQPGLFMNQTRRTRGSLKAISGIFTGASLTHLFLSPAVP